MIKNIFIDCDDTILDFHKAESVALRKTLTEFGITPTDEIVSTYSAINKNLWKMLEKGLTTRDILKVERFRLLLEAISQQGDPKEFTKSYERNLGIGHYFMPGAEEFLKNIKGKYRLYIASNGMKHVQMPRLISANIISCFDNIFISQEVGYNKPSKEFFEVAFSKIQDFSKEESIMIGDSLTSDIKGGINASIKTIWINHQHQVNDSDIKPDFEVYSLDEVLPVIESLNQK